MGWVVGAFFLWVEKRAFAVQAERETAPPVGRGAARQHSLGLGHLFQRRGDDCRQKTGDPPTGQAGSHRPDAGRVLCEVVAERPVELQVDKTGRNDQPAGVETLGRSRDGNAVRIPHCQNPPCLDEQDPVVDLLVRRQQGRTVDAKHGTILVSSAALRRPGQQLPKPPDCAWGRRCAKFRGGAQPAPAQSSPAGAAIRPRSGADSVRRLG